MVYKKPTPVLANRGVQAGVTGEGAQPNPMQRIVFFFTMALVFIRFSMIHQVQTMVMGVNLYLLYIFGVPALLGVLATGGIARTLRLRPGLYWTLFGVWLYIALPFSSWKGGSLPVVVTFCRTDLLMIFVIAGGAVTWSDCRRLMGAIALAALVNLAAAQLFRRTDDYDRLHLSFGTVSNANDYAGHMVVVLPFLLWVILSGRPVIFRIVAFLAIPYGIYVILATASRGGLVALGVGVLYTLVVNPRLRIPVLCMAPIVFVTTVRLLPPSTWQRLTSFSDTHSTGEALESANAREYLLKTSLIYIAEHPLFGVGAGQFASYEGKSSREQGEFGMWHDTHNTFTQIACENGLPAFFFFIAGIGSSMVLLTRVYRASKDRPECNEISVTAFCLMLAMVSFCAAIFFLNFGYFFYLPAMGGLATCVSSAATAEFQKTAAAVPAAPSNPYWQPNVTLPQRNTHELILPHQTARLGRQTKLR